MLVDLSSVGWVMDTKTFFVHKKFNGIEDGVHIDEVTDEWMSSLSTEDFLKVGKIIGILSK